MNKKLLIFFSLIIFLISIIASSLPFRFVPTHMIVKQVFCVSCHPDEAKEISQTGNHLRMMDYTQTRVFSDYIDLYGNISQEIEAIDATCYQCHLTFSNYNLFGLTDPYMYTVGNYAYNVEDIVVKANLVDAQYGYVIDWPFPFGNRTIEYFNNSNATITAELTVTDVSPVNSSIDSTMKIILSNYSGQQIGNTVCDCFQTLSKGDTHVTTVSNMSDDYFNILIFLEGTWNSSTLNLKVTGIDKGTQSFTIYASNPPVLYNVPRDLMGVSYFKTNGTFKAVRLDAIWNAWTNYSVNGHITSSEDIQVSMGGKWITKNTCGAPHGMCHINQKATSMGMLNGLNSSKSFYSHKMQSVTSKNCKTCHLSGRLEGTGSDCLGCHQVQQGGNPAIDVATFTMHRNVYTNDGINTLSNGDCITCHYDTSTMLAGTVATLACTDCHRDGTNNAPIVAEHNQGGQDIITPNTMCGMCHNNSGMYIQNSITNVTMSGVTHYLKEVTSMAALPYQHFGPIDTSNCIECHNGQYTGNASWGSPVNIATSTKRQHNETQTSQCDQCHNDGTVASLALVDFHNASLKLGSGGDCLGCHTSQQGVYPAIDTASFTMHRNVNTADGINTLTNTDCQACHYDTSNMMSGTVATLACADCHTGSGKFNAPLVAEHDQVGKDIITQNATCESCHSNSGMYTINNVTNSTLNSVTHYLKNVTDRTTLPYQHYGVIDTSNCILCHNGLYTNDPAWGSPVNISTSIKRQHNETNTSQCDQCHNDGTVTSLALVDFHNASLKKGSYGSCLGCHTSQQGSYPAIDVATFTMHKNVDTTDRIDNLTDADCQICHYDTSNMMSGTVATLACADCHTGNGKFNAPLIAEHNQVGQDIITLNTTCELCHSNSGMYLQNNVTNVTTSGVTHYLKYVTNTATLPYQHSGTIDTSNCIDCHNGTYTNDPNWGSPVNIATSNKRQHNETQTIQCDLCHNDGTVTSLELVDFHNASLKLGSGSCIGCHPAVASSYFGLHKNINTADGVDALSDNDCTGCHFNMVVSQMKTGYANYSNTYFCEDCHTSSGRNPAQYARITNATLRKTAMPPGHAQNKCEQCHIAGDNQPKPLPPEYQYHTNGPAGTAAGKNCFSCHYRSDGARDGGANIGLMDKPFNAPGEAHYCLLCHGSTSGQVNGRPTSCSMCHTSNDNHNVNIGNHHGESTTLSGLTITSPVNAGGYAMVNATVSSTLTQIARAQYRVVDSNNNIVRDWTEMNAIDGKFDERIEPVIGIIDTTGLSGSYTVLVRGMSSAARGAPAGGINHDTTKPYYPDNAVWTDAKVVSLTVT